MNPSRVQLITQSRNTGERYGDVIIAELHNSRDEPPYAATAFLGDVTDDVSLVPEMEKKEYDYRYRSDPYGGYWAQVGGLPQQLHESRYDLSKRQLLLALGAPVLGGTVELATQSLLTSVAATLGGLALYGGSLFRADSRRRGELGNALADIKRKLVTPGEAIHLRRTNELYFLDEPAMAQLEAQDIPIAGSPAYTMKGGDILAWLQQGGIDCAGHSDLVYGHPKEHQYNSDYPTGFYVDSAKPMMRLHASLWQLFRDARTNSYPYWDQRADIDKFVSVRNELARQANVTLKRGLFMPKFPDTERRSISVSGWRDAPVSLIYLPPNRVVKNLLQNDTDPTALWQSIAPDVAMLEPILNAQQTLSERVEFINKRHKTIGNDNEYDCEELREIDATKQANKQEILTTTLSIIAAAVVRDRRNRYDAIREELFTSINATANAEDQFSAIQLFDTAINALVLNLEPDSEKAIKTARKLTDYLKDVAQFVDGSRGAYQQVYEGLRNKFPSLNLTPVD